MEWVVVHRGKCTDNINPSFVSRCGHWMLIATFRPLTASLLQAIGSTNSGSPLCSCVACSDCYVSILLLLLSAVRLSFKRNCVLNAIDP